MFFTDLLPRLVSVLDGLGEVEVHDVVVVIRHVRLAAFLAELGIATLAKTTPTPTPPPAKQQHIRLMKNPIN